MTSPEAQKLLAEMQANTSPERSLADERAAWEADASATPLPEGTTLEMGEFGGVRCQWVRCGVEGRDPVILLLHGGGYRAGSIVTHRGFAARLSRHIGVTVLVPDYRLAPEHPFPAAIEDVLAVYGAMLASGLDASRIVLAGDSSGGGLAVALALALKNAGTPLPRALVLFSPWVDLECRGASHNENRERDPFLSRKALIAASSDYRGGRSAHEPLISPVNGDLEGLPPMLIHAGGIELLRDDARLLAQRAVAAGTEVALRIIPGMWHIFMFWPDEVPEVADAFDATRSFFARQFRATEDGYPAKPVMSNAEADETGGN